MAKTDTHNKILSEIVSRDGITPHELSAILGIGLVSIHRHLKSLLSIHAIEKLGSAPRVFYRAKVSPTPLTQSIHLPEKYIASLIDSANTIDKTFLHLSPDGTETYGVAGFVLWCSERDFEPEKKSSEYIAVWERYSTHKKEKTINATAKLTSSFKKEELFLNELHYLYPYSLPLFGKTKIAQLLFHAKQTQNVLLIRKLITALLPEIIAYIQSEGFNAIGFIPPTVKRSIQFMTELKNALKINLPHISIEKIKTPIMIQQKSLKHMSDRIINADKTFIVPEYDSHYNRVLLIDDFTGSGATLNQITKKLKRQSIANQVVGLTITGSMNGFDVVNEI